MPLRVHRKDLNAAARARRVEELLGLVGLRSTHAAAYPRELSGGQCQRVSIARALSLEPELVVLDEAVSAVDVSIQARILNLLRELQERLGLDVSLRQPRPRCGAIHVGQARGRCTAGESIESGPRDRLFQNPLHPYTHALLASIPTGVASDRRAHAIVHEDVPTDAEIKGCRFHPRCPLGSRAACREVEPDLELVASDHRAACHFPQTTEGLRREAADEAIASR